MKLQKKLLIISVTCLILLTSGCIYPSSENKTFTDENMSFKYPSNLIEISYEIDTTNSSMRQIGCFGSSQMFLLIGKNKTNLNQNEILDKVISKQKKQELTELLTTTNETNPNGITVLKITYTQQNSSQSEKILYHDMYFKINNTMYVISIYGPKTNEKEINNVTNSIFQSIK